MARAGDAESVSRPATVVIIIHGLFAAFGRRPFAGRARRRPGGGGRSRCRTLLVLRRRGRGGGGGRVEGVPDVRSPAPEPLDAAAAVEAAVPGAPLRAPAAAAADGKQAAVALPV